MNDTFHRTRQIFKQHFWGLLLLVVLLVCSYVVVYGLHVGSSTIIRGWKERHPGSMSVLESQAMDMTVM